MKSPTIQRHWHSFQGDLLGSKRCLLAYSRICASHQPSLSLEVLELNDGINLRLPCQSCGQRLVGRRPPLTCSCSLFCVPVLSCEPVTQQEGGLIPDLNLLLRVLCCIIAAYQASVAQSRALFGLMASA